MFRVRIKSGGDDRLSSSSWSLSPGRSGSIALTVEFAMPSANIAIDVNIAARQSRIGIRVADAEALMPPDEPATSAAARVLEQVGLGARSLYFEGFTVFQVVHN
jgi:hypothetical protein